MSDLPPPLGDYDYHVDLHKSYIRIALHDAYKAFSNTCGLEVQFKPARGVFTTEDVAKNTLCLVPLSSNVQILLNEKLAPVEPAGFRVGDVFMDQPSKKKAVAYIKKYDIVASVLAKPFHVHFWNVGTTKDRSFSNVQIRHNKVAVTTDVDDAKEHFIQVPCLVNTCALLKGAELLMYKPEKVKNDNPLAGAPVPKLAKTASKGKGSTKGGGKGRK